MNRKTYTEEKDFFVMQSNIFVNEIAAAKKISADDAKVFVIRSNARIAGRVFEFGKKSFCRFESALNVVFAVPNCLEYEILIRGQFFEV